MQLKMKRLKIKRLLRTGVPRSRERASLQDPTVGLCLRPHGGLGGEAVFLERGTLVMKKKCVYVRSNATWPPGTGLPRSEQTAPPKDHRRGLGVVLLQGPRKALFHITEVLMCSCTDDSSLTRKCIPLGPFPVQ